MRSISNDLIKYSKHIVPYKIKLDIKFDDNSMSEIAENKSIPYAKNSSDKSLSKLDSYKLLKLIKNKLQK